MPGMLAPYRVLDLTDHRGDLATFVMAGLGADVIKVEPPTGSPSRSVGPLADVADHDDSTARDAGGSLAFLAWNRGKRSVVLDLDADEDRVRFFDLAATADFVFENAGPGIMESRGIGFETLRERRPGLVYVAISPFGHDGPYADHAATDLTLAAMGGSMALTGDPDRQPVRITVPQTWLHASAESALASLVAHRRSLDTGEAQFVDMSVQAAVFWTGLNAMIRPAIDGRNDERCGTELHLATMQSPLVHPCADGEVCFLPMGVGLIGLLGWMTDEDAVDPAWIAAEDWETYERRRLDGDPVTHSPDDVLAVVRSFTAQCTKAELFTGAVARGITLVPVNTAADTISMTQLTERDYWRELAIGAEATVRAPGPFAKSTVAPIDWTLPAPQLGEHTDEVLAEFEPDAAVDSAPRPPAVATDRLPLQGIKVADFSWIGVGPITAKSLADHGATVVRIESEERPDRLRLVGPFSDGEIGINRCQFYGSFNTSKQSLHLDLKHPVGVDIARKMLAWCDIAIDSFTAGTLDRLGLGYQVARELNPAIIMAETCLFGQTGPLSNLAGYGYHAASVSGFYEVTGWNDRAPAGPWNAYTDTIAPRFLTTTLLAALDHRRRTGEGQYIDHAQMESALHFLGPQLLDVQLSGRSARRAGNLDPVAAPHDSYPCAGDDQWIAIAVETDAQWRDLRRVLGDPEWASDPDLDTAEGRRANLGVIDSHIGEFTVTRDRYQLMAELQAFGVPAGVVQRASDLLEDPQLAHRRFFRPLDHPEMGTVPYEGHQYRIAGYDNGPRTPAPCLGEHTFDVLTELLGLDPGEAVEVLSSGACG